MLLWRERGAEREWSCVTSWKLNLVDPTSRCQPSHGAGCINKPNCQFTATEYVGSLDDVNANDRVFYCCGNAMHNITSYFSHHLSRIECRHAWIFRHKSFSSWDIAFAPFFRRCFGRVVACFVLASCEDLTFSFTIYRVGPCPCTFRRQPHLMPTNASSF